MGCVCLLGGYCVTEWEKSITDILAYSPKFEIALDNNNIVYYSEPLCMSSHALTWQVYANYALPVGLLKWSWGFIQSNHIMDSNTKQCQQKLSACQGNMNIMFLVVGVGVVAAAAKAQVDHLHWNYSHSSCSLTALVLVQLLNA